ncbi:AbrB family transcriptional regulator [Wenxinia marina]|uniref:AbrB family transcriptional regulator n=1 Tax=Wenxinia marina TaxID=390641 RepID=UPI0003A774C0|nr:AbrB family transcriptional regulator [Wenxinia marina]
MSLWLQRGAALGAAAAAGALLDSVGVPLAWILGPLIATAALSIFGRPVLATVRMRRAGQLVIGLGLGLNITAALLAQIAVWIPVMIVIAVTAACVTGFFSVFYAHFGRLDRNTAYFAMMPGGLSEMANIGAAAGARSEPIAVAQTVRLGVVVLVLPPTIIALGIHGDFATIVTAAEVPYPALLPLFLVGLAGVYGMRRLGAANPWMLGALVAAAALSSVDLIGGHLPQWLFLCGQYLLGMAVGARFRRDIVVRLPRLFLLGVVFTLLVTAALFGVAALLSAATGLDLATAALASSAGGIAEMAVTAQVLQLNAALILGFHVTRAIMVNAFSRTILDLQVRLKFLPAVERLEVALFGPRRED